MAGDLLVLILMIGGLAYWLDAIRCKELAREAGRSTCKRYELVFLDDTVAITKTRLRRDHNGHMKLYREYQFEFTSDGYERYKGTVSLLGKFVNKVNMDAYHFNA